MDQIATALTSGLVEWINRQNRVKKNSVYWTIFHAVHADIVTCSYCEPMFTFITNFKIEVEEILSFSSISNSERSAVNMIKVKLDYHFNRYNNYVGHQVRLCNEGGLINRMKKERRLKEKSIHNLLITFDWSMKILDNNCMNGSSVCCVKK
jgi:hypothetical protein